MTTQAPPILVAGREGQLARSLLPEARQRGVPLVALSAPQLDLTVPQSIERAIAAIAPRAIVNAAAYTSVDRAESEPALLRRMIGFKTSARRARADRVGI